MRAERAGRFSVERVFMELVPAFEAHPEVAVEVLRVPCSSASPLAVLRNLWFTFRVRADAIHVCGDIQYCALASRCRTILTVLDLVSLHRMRGIKRAVHMFVWYTLPLRRSSNITVISDAVRRELCDLFPHHSPKVEVVHCPIPGSLRQCRARKPSSITKRILQVGTKPNKNLERVVAALASKGDIELRIVGPLSETQTAILAESMIRWSNVVDLSDEEMASEFLAADALIFVSTYEGFGLPIIEAQRAGLPVITSSIAPMDEVAGEGALYANPLDINDIARAIDEFLHLETESMKDLLDLAEANTVRFASDRIAERYVGIYRRARFD